MKRKTKGRIAKAFSWMAIVGVMCLFVAVFIVMIPGIIEGARLLFYGISLVPHWFMNAGLVTQVVIVSVLLLINGVIFALVFDYQSPISQTDPEGPL